MKHDHHTSKPTGSQIGFQIAPMIDVVFVIMLYFMMMAGTVKVEKTHNTSLPGVPPDDPVRLYDEIVIRVEDDGQVYLNDDPLDSPEAPKLTELAENLRQLRDSSNTSKSDVFVTIDANENATYQRVVDVLDALSLAAISKVSFNASAPN